VEEAWRRHGEAYARLLGEEARDRGRVAGILLVAERQHANARGPRHAAEIGDRDAGHAIDGGETVELERVDEEMKTVGQLALGCIGGGFFFPRRCPWVLLLRVCSL